VTPTFKRSRAKPHRLSDVEIKALVRHRDGYRCQSCGLAARQSVKKYGRTLEVHRRSPGARYSLKGCVTLCKSCHAEAHGDLIEPFVRSVAVTVPPPLLKVMDQYIAENCPAYNRAAVVRMALAQYLERRGFLTMKAD
jgi:hypothetical protein